jgi:hypothetical protein
VDPVAGETAFAVLFASIKTTFNSTTFFGGIFGQRKVFTDQKCLLWLPAKAIKLNAERRMRTKSKTHGFTSKLAK